MVIRVAQLGKRAFQLRSGEQGISVFVSVLVDPPLTESEVLDGFRPGSIAVIRADDDILTKGLVIVPVPGTGPLPDRFKQAHPEIRAGSKMSRTEFKRVLEELE